MDRDARTDRLRPQLHFPNIFYYLYIFYFYFFNQEYIIHTVSLNKPWEFGDNITQNIFVSLPKLCQAFFLQLIILQPIKLSVDKMVNMILNSHVDHGTEVKYWAYRPINSSLAELSKHGV